MPSKDYLIQLIQSLSPNERRYFKLTASIQPGEKKYVQLFEALEDKTEYNAGEIGRQLGLTPKQLVNEKYYLPQVILRVLRNAEEQSSDIQIVYRYKEDAISLLRRRLDHYALEVLEKALAKAWELELFELIGELLLTKHSCLYNLQRYDELAGITVEYQKAMAALSELFAIYGLRGTATGFAHSPKNAGKLKALINHPLLKMKMKSLKSLKAQIVWINIHHLISVATNNVAALLSLSREEVKHFEKHPAIKIINPVAYLVGYTHLSTAEAAVGNYKVALQVMEDLKPLLKPSAQLTKARSESIYFYVELSSCRYLAHLNRYDESAERLEKLMDKMEKRPLAEQFTATFFYAVSLFHLGRTSEALVKTEELLSIKDEISGELQIYVRPLMMLIQLQMGNYTLIPYLIKSAKSWMKRQKLDYPEGDLLFKHLQSTAKPSLLPRNTALSNLEKLIDSGKFPDSNENLNLKDWVIKKRKQRA